MLLTRGKKNYDLAQLMNQVVYPESGIIYPCTFYRGNTHTEILKMSCYNMQETYTQHFYSIFH